MLQCGKKLSCTWQWSCSWSVSQILLRLNTILLLLLISSCSGCRWEHLSHQESCDGCEDKSWQAVADMWPSVTAVTFTWALPDLAVCDRLRGILKGIGVLELTDGVVIDHATSSVQWFVSAALELAYGVSLAAAGDIITTVSQVICWWLVLIVTSRVEMRVADITAYS